MPKNYMQHVKWEAAHSRARSWRDQQVVSTLFHTEQRRAISPLCGLRLSISFWITAAVVPFPWVSPVYFGEHISPQSLDNRSAATAEVEGKHGQSWLGLKYLWSFTVVIVWVLTAKAHYRDPSQNKRPDVLLSVVTWGGESKCTLFQHKSSLRALLIFHLSPFFLVIKRPLCKVEYRSSTLLVCCFIFARFLILLQDFLQYYFLQISR